MINPHATLDSIRPVNADEFKGDHSLMTHSRRSQIEVNESLNLANSIDHMIQPSENKETIVINTNFKEVASAFQNKKGL